MDIGTIAVIGGDERFAILASLLAQDGHTVFGAGFDIKPELADGVVLTDPLTAALMAQSVILPLPPTSDGIKLSAPLSYEDVPLDERLCLALERSRVYCGMPHRLAAVSERYGKLQCRDYSTQESFLLLNAQLTVEAALMLAIKHLPVSLFGTRCLVTGYGRIGRAMALALRSLGAEVTIAARREEHFAHAKTLGLGCCTYAALPACVEQYRLVVNCADALVLSSDVIAAMDSDALIIDLASLPGGTDFAFARERGITALHALGLPGKYAPLSAAQIIKDTVTAMIEEEFH